MRTVHVTCVLGAAQLLADGTDRWDGTVMTLFQPAEETGDGLGAAGSSCCFFGSGAFGARSCLTVRSAGYDGSSPARCWTA